MGLQVITDCKAYLAGYNISGNSNKLAIKQSAESLDKTTFADAGWKVKQAGLKSVEVDLEGFWEANGLSSATYKIDDLINSYLGVGGKLLTIAPLTGAQGELCFNIPAMIGEYQFGGNVGDLAPFSFKGDASSMDGIIRGTIMENGIKSATGNGTAQNLGAVLSTQKLFAGLHILAVSGTLPTLDLKIQSASAQAFTTPTDRITFAQQNAIGAVWAPAVAGPITDTWWRASWTLGGTTPNFTAVIVVGIQ